MSGADIHDFDDQAYDTKPGSDEPMHVRVLDRTAGLVITAIASRDAHIRDLDAETVRWREEAVRLRKALGDISRMKCNPDAKFNMMTLAAAITVARNALPQPPCDTEAKS
jgi:hypothetical protein